MVRILYGLCGVGIGHAIRGKIIIEHLRKKNDVMIVSSNKPYEYLKKCFKKVHNIEGFELAFKKNSIINYLTLLINLRKFSKKGYSRFKEINELLDQFNPDLVISDWETFSSFYAKKKKIPLISIGNQHFLISGVFNFPKKYLIDYLKAKLVLKLLMKKADYNIITSFSQTKLKKNYKNIFLVPPVLRDEILNCKIKKKDYILVYQSTDTYKKLIDILKNVGGNFIIYGFDKSSRDNNLKFKRFNEKEFLKDLNNCKGVICNGGFTLISEATYLKKPILSVPIKKHFEQLINCLYVKKMGYGECYRNLNAGKVRGFIHNLDKYKKSEISQKNNNEIFKILDEITERI